MEKRYETRSGDLFVRSWARVRRVSLDRRSSAGETDGVCRSRSNRAKRPRAGCILRSGFEPSTSVSKTDILANRPICSIIFYFLIIDGKLMFVKIDITSIWRKIPLGLCRDLACG